MNATLKSRILWVLMIAGTILAAVGGARLPTADWTVSGIGVALLIAGFVVSRIDVEDGSELLPGVGKDPIEAMRSLLPRVEELVGMAEQASLSDISDQLEALQTEVLSPLGDRVPGMLSKLGPQRYAAVFGPYARAERNLARSWSAAADGHRTETYEALQRARDHLAGALAEVDGA